MSTGSFDQLGGCQFGLWRDAVHVAIKRAALEKARGGLRGDQRLVGSDQRQQDVRTIDGIRHIILARHACGGIVGQLVSAML